MDNPSKTILMQVIPLIMTTERNSGGFIDSVGDHCEQPPIIEVMGCHSFAFRRGEVFGCRSYCRLGVFNNWTDG